MSFLSIVANTIKSGRALKASLFTNIKDNFDDHESRITATEAAVEGQAPLLFRVNGTYSALSASGKLNLLKSIVSSDITITNIFLYIDKAGTLGTTEINILTNTLANPAYTSVFSTRPSVGFGSGDDAKSSNGILNLANVNIDAGDIIRLDLLNVQSGTEDGFEVLIEYNFR